MSVIGEIEGMTLNQMIGKIAETRGIKLDPNDPAFVLVDLNRMALEPFLAKLQELEKLPNVGAALDAFKMQMADAIIKGNERVIQALSNQSTPKQTPDDISPALDKKVKDHFEIFSAVHEQWYADVDDVGKQMATAQNRSEELLKQTALLLAKVTTAASGQALAAPISTNPPMQKSKQVSVFMPVLASVFVTAALFIGGYYISGISKAADLGGALIRDWSKLDLPTRTKITNTLNSR